MSQKAFQDFYPEDTAHCYGCGRLNEVGHQLKSYWAENGLESVAYFSPQSYHTAIPGYVYGGLLASLVDCHATGTAAAAAYREEKRSMGSDPALRYVTASLQVNFLKPTPLGPGLEIRGKITEIKPRKAVVAVTIQVNDDVTVEGKVVCVQMPESMRQQG